MTRKVASLACILAAAALAGCHGPPLKEADGGAAGASGIAGRGGAAGGTAGAGCAAQMTTPAVFYRGELPPAWTEGTTDRFYWAENGAGVTVHFAQGDQPVAITHPFKIAVNLTDDYFDLAASDVMVAGNWDTDGKLAVWGPDGTPTTPLAMTTLGRLGSVAVVGTTVYYSHDPVGGNPTPGVYQWQLPNPASLFASFTTLGGGASLGLILRATSDKLLFSDRHKIYMVDLAGGPPQLLSQVASPLTIVDVRPARPHSLDAGVILVIEDSGFPIGRDHYVDITRPANTPTDLSAATTALAVSTACGYDAQYVGGGVLFNHRYIYQGQFGLFAVDVAANGALSNLVRLNDAPYSHLEVTGDGDLFGSWPDVNNVGKWEYSRIGRL